MSKLFARLTVLPLALAGALLALPPAKAAVITFAANPLIGAPGVNLNDNTRQVFGGAELTLPSFTPGTDQFSFDLAAFGVASPLSFFNGQAANLPTGDMNVVVLQDTDNDNNPATGFNAGTAANLIAAAIDDPGAGFFIYHNSGLQVNRLVYSTDLSTPTADLAILARIASPTATAAIAALPSFTANEFTAVPAPAALPTFLAAIGMLGLALRRRAG